MNKPARRSPAMMSIARAGERLAPWGQYSRYMFRNYSRHTFILIAALLSIALTTDLSVLIWRLIADNSDANWFWLTFLIARMVVLRGTDLLALAVPIASFLGVLWTEIAHTWSRQRIAIWNLGRSPAQCIVPVLLFGAMMGSLQFTLDTWLRPAAVMKLENRPDAAHPDFNFSAGLQWLAVGGDLIHARISPGPPPSLGEVTIYRLGSDGALLAVLTAEKAAPGAEPGMWRLENAKNWSAASPPKPTETSPSASDRDAAANQTFKELDIVLNIDPLWLSKFGIHPQYLPHDTLRALATPSAAGYSVQVYRVWFYARYANGFLPGGMVLLAACMAMRLIAYRIRPWAIFGIAAAGYAAHVLEKAFLVLGEFNELPPLVAVWSVPFLLVAASAIVLFVPVTGVSGGAVTAPRAGRPAGPAPI